MRGRESEGERRTERERDRKIQRERQPEKEVLKITTIIIEFRK